MFGTQANVYVRMLFFNVMQEIITTWRISSYVRDYYGIAGFDKLDHSKSEAD